MDSERGGSTEGDVVGAWKDKSERKTGMMLTERVIYRF